MIAEYHYRCSEDYFVTAYARYRRQRWWYSWLRGAKVLITVALLGLVVLSIYDGRRSLIAISLGLLAWFVVMIVLSLGIDNWILRRRLRKSPYFNDDAVVRLSDEGVSATGRHYVGQLEWNVITKARRFADGLLLFQGPYYFHWLPDSACTEQALLPEIEDLVRNRIRDYRDIEQRATADGASKARSSSQASGSEHTQ